MTHRARFVRASLAAVLGASLLLAGCAKKTEQPAAPEQTELAPIRIGTLPTEDSLPLWVAEQDGLYGVAGIPEVKLVTFQSAQERDAAFTSGAIDAYMGDIIAATNMESADVPVTILTVMLGADQRQGRFGIVVPPGSKVTSLKQLAGVPVGTSSATIQEYVLDGLMTEAGIEAEDVVVEEVKKVPVRYELLMSGKLKAAALPEPFLSLALKNGAKLVGDDTTAQNNLSQTVLIASDNYLSTKGGAETAKALLGVWNTEVGKIASKPETYRDLLVGRARVPEPIARDYAINLYQPHQLPGKPEVDAVIKWMQVKGYMAKPVGYDDLTVAPVAK